MLESHPSFMEMNVDRKPAIIRVDPGVGRVGMDLDSRGTLRLPRDGKASRRTHLQICRWQ